MIFTIILLCLFFSFLTHIVSLFNYVTKKSERSLRYFIKTAISNVVLILIFTLIVKIRIFINIYKRSKLPENYHLNFFGKKVLHSTVVNKMEIVIFCGTMPFFLISGSYFVARLVNFFLYTHL